ncbi:MAG: type II secretion system protein GspM [Gammaproteobacteria bacterium]
MVNSLRAWFEQLAPRERLLVAAAAGVIVLAVIIMAGVRPVMSQSKRGHELVEDKRELLAELREVAARLGPQRGAGAAAARGSTQSLVLVIDQTTRSSGLAQHLKRNQPDGADSIRLRFENAPFDNLVTWLNTLQNQHGISVTSANIDASQQPGRVNCNLTVARQGA